MTARRVVVWRHGQTNWNVAGRFQGQFDVALNDRGIAQARAAAQSLTRLNPATIVSSDLSRAQQTANVLASLVDVPVTTDTRLREINVGEWAGLVVDEACAADPGFAAALSVGEDYRRSASGETAVELGERVAAAIHDHGSQAADGSTVVLVSHGLATRMGIATLLGLSYAQSLLFAGPRNCSWAVLEPGRHTPWRLLSYNNMAPALSADGLTVDDAW